MFCVFIERFVSDIWTPRCAILCAQFTSGAMLQLQAICFFGKPEISLTKLTEHALMTATRLSELTFPSSKSHMVRGLLPGWQPSLMWQSSSSTHTRTLGYRACYSHIIFEAGRCLTFTFTSAASPDPRLHADVTSMRLTHLYRGEPNRIGSTCEKKKTGFVFKVPSRFSTVDA